MPSNRPHVQFSTTDANAIETYEAHIGQRGRWAAGAAALVVLTLLLYAATLQGTFIFCDDQVISDNPALRTWYGLVPIWIHPTIMPHYQPLAYSALLVEFKLFGTIHPGGYLAVNAFLHALAAVLLWTLLRKLEVSGALAAAAIFAVHPVNVETVAWMSQQPLLLGSVLYVSALLVYLRYDGINPPAPIPMGPRLPESRWALYTISMMLFAAALMSHGAAVTMPVAALVLIWWERGRVSPKQVVRASPLLAMAAAWLAIALYADLRHSAAMGSASGVGLVSQALACCRAVWIYVWHLVFPWGLSFAYPKWPIGAIDVAALVGIVGLLVMAWWYRTRIGRGTITAILLFLIALLPTFLLHSDLAAYSYVADHQTYLAAVPLIALAVAAIAALIRSDKAAPQRKWLAASVTVVAVALLATLSLLRLPDYRTPENVWNATLRRDPGSVLANIRLGLIELNQHHDNARAMQYFREALASDPNDPQTHINIASVYEADKEIEKAINEYYLALSLANDNLDAHFGLARVLAEQGNSEQAIREYQIVLDGQPNHVLAYNNLGLLHADRGENAPAEQCYRHAIQLNPGFIPAYINLANLLFAQGKVQEAADILTQVARVDPTNFEVFMNAGAMVGNLALNFASQEEKSKLFDQSIAFFKHAWQQKPDSALACRQLGVALLQQQRNISDKPRKYDEAIFYLTRATELDHDDQTAQAALEQAKREQQKASPRP